MAGPQPTATPGEGLLRLWYVRLPRAVESPAPRFADGLADGAWTAIWPSLAAYAPVVGAGLGLALGLLLPLVPTPFPEYPRVWSEVLPFMMIVVAAGLLSGTVGVAILVGFAVGDLARLLALAVIGSSTFDFSDPLIATVALVGSALISYLLLAIPALTLPITARNLAERAKLPRLENPAARTLLRGAVYVLAAGLLTFFWTRAVVVLIRPVFVWRETDPTVQAIDPVQFQWEWLAGTAVVAVVARILLQELVARRHPAASRIAMLQAERWADAAPGRLWSRLGRPAWIVVVVATVTFLLAGTYESYVDAILVAIVTTLIVAWRSGFLGAMPVAWVTAVERIPAVVRLGVALGVGYLLARIVIELLWATGSLRPVLIGILLVGAVFVLLFPTRTAPARARLGAPAT